MEVVHLEVGPDAIPLEVPLNVALEFETIQSCIDCVGPENATAIPLLATDIDTMKAMVQCIDNCYVVPEIQTYQDALLVLRMLHAANYLNHPRVDKAVVRRITQLVLCPHRTEDVMPSCEIDSETRRVVAEMHPDLATILQ